MCQNCVILATLIFLAVVLIAGFACRHHRGRYYGTRGHGRGHGHGHGHGRCPCGCPSGCACPAGCHCRRSGACPP